MATLTATKPNIGLTDEHIQGSLEVLNRTLADAHVLYIKARNYHWNVTGSNFEALHEFFEKMYLAVAEEIDEIAERHRMLGGPALGTMTEFLKLTKLKEHPGRYPEANQMLADLLGDQETIIRNLRNDIDRCTDDLHDLGTADFLTEVMKKHEKRAWMTRAILER